ncbi:hypothetical protein CN934_05145 [Ensifer sp. MMN_5]|nr:hypothetical protein CN934_05145 [Ensifer sp. MMN_5]
MQRIAVLLMVSLMSTVAGAQSFTCPMGKSPSCLDYSDKVCSSFAKCVADDAVCFDSFTCNYKGFVCKSVLEEAVELHDDVVRKYNSLLDERNSIAQRLAVATQENNENIERNARLFSTLQDAESCVGKASTLEEAQACSF